MVLDPIELRALAAAWDAAARTATAEAHLAADTGHHLARASTGSLHDGALRLTHVLTPWRDTAAELRAGATILRLTASLHEHLSQWVRRLTPRAEASGILDPLLDAASTLGDVLDWQCANAIRLLCTPTWPTGTTLGTYHDLDLAAVHEMVLLDNPDLVPLASAHPDALFLEAPGGGVVAAFGDIDTAPAVATFIPGVGSADPARWASSFAHARAVHQATGAAAVAWIGYNAPASLDRALNKEPARHAGAELRRFQRDLRARNPHARLTVIGYSYGSVVAGTAARDEPLIADSLVLVGSPGVPADSAADLHVTGRGGVHAMTAAGDPIDLAAGPRGGVHGTDPTSRRFGARVWEVGPGDHGSYWNDPAFFDALRQIVR